MSVRLPEPQYQPRIEPQGSVPKQEGKTFSFPRSEPASAKCLKNAKVEKKLPDIEISGLVSSFRKALASDAHVEKLSQIFDSCDKKVLAKAIRHLFKDPMPLEHKQKIREFLATRFGQHTESFMYGPDAFNNDYVKRNFTPHAISNILNYLKEKGVITLPYTICCGPEGSRESEEINGYEKLRKEIYSIVTSSDPKSQLPHIFFCRESKMGHMTPLCLYTTDKGTFRLVVTDSIGGQFQGGNEFWTTMFKLLLDLDKIGQFQSLEIYNLETIRQTSAYDCTVFCINDGIRFCKRSENLDLFVPEEARTDFYEAQKTVIFTTQQKLADIRKALTDFNLQEIAEQSSDEKLFDLFIAPTRKLKENYQIVLSEEDSQGLDERMDEIHEKNYPYGICELLIWNDGIKSVEKATNGSFCIGKLSKPPTKFLYPTQSLKALNELKSSLPEGKEKEKLEAHIQKYTDKVRLKTKDSPEGVLKDANTFIER